MRSESVSIEKDAALYVAKRKFYFIVKRLFDIVCGVLGCLLLLPMIFVIKIISLVNKDRDSIFFKQERIGKDGKLFTLYKFRSMVPDADQILLNLMQTDEEFRKEYTIHKKAKNDPRITPIGRILRKTSLDEFPQFINVLKGDMSMIGNRPYLPREQKDMGKYYHEIIKTKPGITGYWQTNGRSNTTFKERLKLEKKYNEMQGFKIDLKIMINTVIQVFKKDGAE